MWDLVLEAEPKSSSSYGSDISQVSYSVMLFVYRNVTQSALFFEYKNVTQSASFFAYKNAPAPPISKILWKIA